MAGRRRFVSPDLKIFRKLSYELWRVGANQIASVESVHRNIAEGYCRRSLNEYLQFLTWPNSLGESVSGAHVYRRADQISEAELEVSDILAYKLENGLKKLIEVFSKKGEAYIRTKFHCQGIPRVVQEDALDSEQWKDGNDWNDATTEDGDAIDRL